MAGPISLPSMSTWPEAETEKLHMCEKIIYGGKDQELSGCYSWQTEPNNLSYEQLEGRERTHSSCVDGSSTCDHRLCLVVGFIIRHITRLSEIVGSQIDMSTTSAELCVFTSDCHRLKCESNQRSSRITGRAQRSYAHWLTRSVRRNR